MTKLVILFALCLACSGCWYADYQQGMAKLLSPEYRAYDRQQRHLTEAQKAARDKQACVQLGC